MPLKISTLLNQVKKRNGEIIAFNQTKITNAILKAMEATSQGNIEEAEKVSDQVFSELRSKYRGMNMPSAKEQLADL